MGTYVRLDYRVLSKTGSYLFLFQGMAENEVPPLCPGGGFVPATAFIGPLPEHHYLELNIEREEEDEAERIRERLVLKAQKANPRWLYQT